MIKGTFDGYYIDLDLSEFQHSFSDKFDEQNEKITEISTRLDSLNDIRDVSMSATVINSAFIGLLVGLVGVIVFKRR